MKKTFTMTLIACAAIFAIGSAMLLVGPGKASAQSYAQSYYPYGACYVFSNDLQIGSTGPAVEALHSLLAREGLSRSNSWSVSAQVYNEETASLVSGLQERYASEILTPAGLRYGTGFVGTRTRAKLNSMCTGSGTGTNSLAPVISNLSAPSTLQTNQTGTWSLTATDPQNSQITYYISWGDEYLLPYPVSSAAIPSTTGYNQQSTFTHAYATAGTYSITIRARNAMGYESQTTTTVYVTGNSNCVYGSYNCGSSTNVPRVISPNGGEWLQKGSYKQISWSYPNVLYFAAQPVDVNFILQGSNQYPYTYGAAVQQGYSTCPIGSTCAYNPGQSSSYPYYPYDYSNQYSYGTKYNVLQNTTLNSYNWYVGSTPTGWSTMVSGTYLMQVCLSGTTNCDVSDSTFTIY